ncbi:UMP kinase [Candidatus Cerribacteria bacterium 'Amazon FNV 2010 28 9']|uniref:Uridylate kinase n=1 Tax=Candidatus Cerribacteria bacterium 'Amazon FNV 2010 28 9' TaxID=2081795 RepID=A0A317JN93_9BACT|nr:MAG: UMP kinase [Candidatus Cerribacteria bacterium 'Amazon FNV 2010 28 9']
MAQPAYQRVLLKLGGEIMLGQRQSGVDPEAARDVAEQIKQVYDAGVQIAIVIGGGNIFRGVSGEKNGVERATADYMGMLATVINALALQDALEKAGIPTRVQSALSMPAVAENFVRRKAIRHMEKGRIVILAAGTGVPYVTTDTGATLHALELGCEIVMKATKVDGVYDKDPLKYPDAKRFSKLSYMDAIKDPNIAVMDTAGLTMCMENKMKILVFDAFKTGNLLRAVMGDDIGTLVE